MSEPVLSVILPAHNEGAYIGACLAAVLASDCAGFEPELIVVANACTDNTSDVVRRHVPEAQAKGWRFHLIDSAEPGKLPALNLGEAEARGGVRVYLDADVIVAPTLLRELAQALEGNAPRYASGTPVVSPATSAVTRAFARVWQRLPFVTKGVPGFGVFALNTAGRKRWGEFPEDIISDDTFVRLQFAPAERVRVPATYSWPMVEGLRNLVRVRRRQDQGVTEIAARFPDLMRNEDSTGPGLAGAMRIAASDPIGFGIYMLVKLLVKTPYARNAERWARGR